METETLSIEQQKQQEQQLAKLDFVKRHGESVTVAGCVYFEDGATHEFRRPRKEPPEDPAERYKLIIKFWQAKLAIAEKEFKNQKNYWLDAAESRLSEKYPGGPPVEQAEVVAILTELADKVQMCRRNLEEAQVELKKSQPDKTRQEQVAEENRIVLGDFIRAVQAVEI